MKKIKDEVLRYLAGMMSESETKLFEQKLKASDELNSQLRCVREKLSDLDLKNIDANELYFNNLLPRMRERLEYKKKHSVLKKIYYLAPALTIIITVIIFFPRSSRSTEFNYQDLAEVVVNNINDEEVTSKYVSENILDPSLSPIVDNSDYSVGLDNNRGKIPDSYIRLLDYSNTETFRMLNNLSDEELNNIYKELSNIKFQ